MLFRSLAVLVLMSFSALAGAECFQDPGIDKKPAYNGSPMTNDGQKALVKQKQKAMSNPPMELMMCAMQAAITGPKVVVDGICGCEEAIEQACDFGFDKGVPFAKPQAGAEWAWCAIFAPIYIGSKLL